MTDMLDSNLNVLRHGKSSVDFVVTVILLMKLLLPALRRPLVPLSDLPGTTVGISQTLICFRICVLNYVQVSELQGLM